MRIFLLRWAYWAAAKAFSASLPGVTATAGVMKAVQQGIIKPNETVTTISTGSGLKDVKNALRAAGRPHKCAPSIEALEASGII